MNIKLELTVDAVNFILQALGDLPSRTGAFVLLKQIEDQAKAQVPAEQQQQAGQPAE
jgi:hypothetical protein